MSQDIAIQVKNLSKKYILKHPTKDVDGNTTQELWALNDVSFEIRKGEAVGIIGPNGSGKSTLLKIMSGVTKPTSGSVTIKGKVASILDIGAGFHPELSGRENVFLNGQLLGFSKKEIKDKYHEIIAFSGIERFIEEPVKNYSNGMYLRLAFSILAHLDFDIYLFDEVMSVGDATFTHVSRQKIMKLKSSGKTIVVISHNLNELSLCNQIIEVDLGRIIQNESNQNTLVNYASVAIEKTDIEIHQCPVKIVEFKGQMNSSVLTLLSLTLKQENKEKNSLSTNLPIYIEIEYYKHIKEDTLDLFLIISDANGVVIFVTSPLLSSYDFVQQEVRKYLISCEIPAGFLSSNIYSIGITFVKNSNVSGTFPINEQLNEDQIKEALSVYDIVATYTNLLFFRVTVVLENFIDLGKLNMPVGLILPLLKWKIINQNNDS
jgi:lipopolysaccharide transport system ATP-binding protein